MKQEYATTSAAHYPSELCQTLAMIHLDTMIARRDGESVSPAEASKVLLNEVEDQQTPDGIRIRAPPISASWDDSTRWKEQFRVSWKRSEISNVVETRMAILSIKHLARASTNWSRRHLLAVDNLCTLCVLSKGRSSRPVLNYLCRQALAITFAHRMRIVLRWVPSLRNHADGPSRGRRIKKLKEGEVPVGGKLLGPSPLQRSLSYHG